MDILFSDMVRLELLFGSLLVVDRTLWCTERNEENVICIEIYLYNGRSLFIFLDVL